MSVTPTALVSVWGRSDDLGYVKVDGHVEEHQLPDGGSMVVVVRNLLDGKATRLCVQYSGPGATWQVKASQVNEETPMMTTLIVQADHGYSPEACVSVPKDQFEITTAVQQ